MEKKFFAVWGRGGLGKSTTIRLAYEKSKKHGTVIDPGDGAYKRPDGPPEVKGAILKINGVLVGFTSYGDNAYWVKRYVKPLIDAGCKVIVCATRSKGRSITELERLASVARPPFQIEWIEKACKQVSHEDGNRRKCDEIVKKVLEAVASARKKAG